MSKPLETETSFVFDLPDGHQIDGVKVDPAGWIAFLDKAGNEIAVEGVHRSVTHARRKGPKVRTRQVLGGVRLSIDGLQELCAYHDVFVIDTSYSHLPTRRRHAVACSLRLRFEAEGDKVRVHADDRLVYYDLVGSEGNPERAAMLALVAEHSRSAADLSLRRALVTDSDLGMHDAINARQTPLYGAAFLPANFTLLYASGDAGSEATNRVLAFCDRQAKAALLGMIAGTAPSPDRWSSVQGAWGLRVGKVVQTDVQATQTLLGRATGVEKAKLIFEGGGRSETVDLDFTGNVS